MKLYIASDLHVEFHKDKNNTLIVYLATVILESTVVLPAILIVAGLI